MTIKNVVFDVGGVLLDFSLRHLYSEEFEDPAELEWFLNNVLTRERWLETDAGKPIAEMVAELSRLYPDYTELLQLVDLQWSRVIRDRFPENINLLHQLNEAGVPLYSVTNFSGQTFPIACKLYPFLKIFRDMVVSGDEKIIKPDPRIFEILLRRNNLDAGECLFIDDVMVNVESARSVGLAGHHFRSTASLREDLKNHGFLP